MDAQISSPTPAPVATATPVSSDPVLIDAVTAQPNGDANGQGASVEETLGNVDPRTLPPQLKSVYDNMLRDYKTKTTKVAETVKAQLAKELEPHREKLSAYEQLVKEEAFVQKWNEYVAEEQAKQNAPQRDPNDPNAKLAKKVQELEKSQEEIHMQVRASEALDTINAFAAAVDDKGEKLHPEFDKLSGFSLGKHEKAGNYDLLRAAVELAPGDNIQQKIENGYKNAEAVYKAIYEEGRKAALGHVQQKVRNGTTAPSNLPAGNLTASRPKDAAEALEWAKKGIAVQR